MLCYVQLASRLTLIWEDVADTHRMNLIKRVSGQGGRVYNNAVVSRN